MALYKTRCPKCGRKLMLPKMAGRVRCPQCQHRFLANGVSESYPVAAAAPLSVAATKPEEGTTAAQTLPTNFAPQPSPSDIRLPEPPAEGEELLAEEEAAWSPAAVAAIGAGGVLVLGLGAWLIAFCLRDPAPADDFTPELSVPAPPPAKKIESTTAAAPQLVLATAKSETAVGPKLPVKSAPLVGAVKPVVVASHPGVDQPKIDAAIERGAAFLTKSYQENSKVGAAALAGLTLLHCGRATTDPAVVEIAGTVRTRGPSQTQTYELALCILFLDRLGDAADRPLIRSIALQLIAGQGIMGGWNYGCQPLNDAQRQQLLTLLESSASAKTAPDPKAPKSPVIGGRISVAQTNLAELPALQYRPGTLLQLRPHGHEDNSLTQFAILALWAAQKQGIPAERSLAFAEARFRSSQGADGTWGYTWVQNRTRNDSMTCAGLLGLAVGRGTRAAAKEGSQKQGDAAIDKALAYVGQRIGILGGSAGQGGKFIGADTWGDLYYLWTLERAAVAYDLQTIGGKDWYAWGAPLIVGKQTPNGSWNEAHGPVPDTCFALLFLKRANVALDLTVRLQELALSKTIVERRGNDPPDRRAFDPFDRRPDLDQSQREAAGYARGRADER